MQKGPPPPTPLPSCFNGMGMSALHLLMFLLHQFWCLCLFLATPNILKHASQQTEVPSSDVFWPRFCSQPVLSWRLWPILPAVPVLGDGYHPLQPQLLTPKEGYEHQPPGLPGDIKYHTEDWALSPGLCVQSRIFPSCSVAETAFQLQKCRRVIQGHRQDTFRRDSCFPLRVGLFPRVSGGAEDYRGKRSGFAPAFRELCGPGLLGVTDKTADMKSGTWACSQLSPAPLSPSTRRQDGPHKTRDLKGPF